MPSLLIVTAVAAERDAIAGGAGLVARGSVGPYELWAAPGVTLVEAGVGPAAAAAATAALLATAPDAYELVVSAGIGGAYGGRAEPGDIVEATELVAADLGAQTADGFAALETLGFGTSRYAATPLSLPGAVRGPVFTVATVTGSTARAAELAARGGVAEGMEGFGVAEAAHRFGVAVGELRAISNAVGPRDRASWDVPGALVALGRAARRLTELTG